MSELYLPENVPPVYRGGPSLDFAEHDVKIDKCTGLLKPTHGISVDAVPDDLVRFGGAFLIKAIPAGLTIIQRGRRTTHFEIVPRSPMTPDRYQELLDQIEREPFLLET